MSLKISWNCTSSDQMSGRTSAPMQLHIYSNAAAWYYFLLDTFLIQFSWLFALELWFSCDNCPAIAEDAESFHDLFYLMFLMHIYALWLIWCKHYYISELCCHTPVIKLEKSWQMVSIICACVCFCVHACMGCLHWHVCVVRCVCVLFGQWACGHAWISGLL